MEGEARLEVEVVGCHGHVEKGTDGDVRTMSRSEKQLEGLTELYVEYQRGDSVISQ
jgi:hypothetical protein